MKNTSQKPEDTGEVSAYILAEKAALRLIARAEQCSNGLARKLEKRGHEADCVNAVLFRLTELKLIDDKRFARLWLESRLRLTRSPRRLLAALCGRGIDKDDAQAALCAVLDEETESAMLERFVKKYSRKAAGKGEDGERSFSRELKYLLRNEGFSGRAIERYLER